MKLFKASLHQNFVIFAKSPAPIIVILLPFFLLFIMGSIFPVSWILPNIITISIIIICFLSVGIQYNEYKETNFFRTTKNTGVSVVSIIIGTFVVTFTIAFMISISLMIFAWFFTSAVPILCQTIDNIRIESLGKYQELIKGEAFFSTFSFAGVNWIIFIYSLTLSIVMTSLFAIMIGNLFTSIKTFTLFSMIYLVLYLLLGGILIPEYVIKNNALLLISSNLLPNFHTNAILNSAINTGISTSSSEYAKYLQGINDWADSLFTNGEYNGTLITNGLPTLEGLDPIDIPAINEAFPWLMAAVITLSSFLTNISGIKLTYDYFSIVYIFFYMAYLSDMLSNWLNLPPWNFNMLLVYETVKNLNNYIINILDSLIPIPYAFDFSVFAIKVNIIPYFIILLSIPTFIRVVMS